MPVVCRHAWGGMYIYAQCVRPLHDTQAAKTYLERKFEVFGSCSVDELIGHGLRALSASVSDGELTPENCTVAVVGKGLSLVLLEGDALKPHIDSLKVRPALYRELPLSMEYL